MFDLLPVFIELEMDAVIGVMALLTPRLHVDLRKPHVRLERWVVGIFRVLLAGAMTILALVSAQRRRYISGHESGFVVVAGCVAGKTVGIEVLSRRLDLL